MPLQKLITNFEFKLADDGQEPGTLEGYGSIFDNTDLGGDVVVKGAFKKSLREMKKAGVMPSMFWMHSWEEPIGEWTEMQEDDKGLFVKGRLWIEDDRQTEAVRKAYNMARSTGRKGLSIGYNAIKYKYEKRDGVDYDVRVLQEVDVMEVSPVPFAMNPAASITSVKNEQGELKTKREIERILRDAGFSAQQAKGLLSQGYAGLRDAGASDEELKSLVEAISKTTAILKGE